MGIEFILWSIARDAYDWPSAALRLQLGSFGDFPSAQAGVLEFRHNFGMAVNIIRNMLYFSRRDFLCTAFIQFFCNLIQISTKGPKLSRRIPEGLRLLHRELGLVSQTGSNAIDYSALRRASLRL